MSAEVSRLREAARRMMEAGLRVDRVREGRRRRTLLQQSYELLRLALVVEMRVEAERRGDRATLYVLRGAATDGSEGAAQAVLPAPVKRIEKLENEPRSIPEYLPR